MRSDFDKPFSSQFCPISVNIPVLEVVSRVDCKFLYRGLRAIMVLVGSKHLA